MTLKRPHTIGLLILVAVVITGSVIVVAGRDPDAVLQTVSLGQYAGPMVLDARTDRVFVAMHNDIMGGGGRLAMLDGVTGAVLRTISLPGSSTTLSVDGQTGAVVVGSGYSGATFTGQVMVLDGQTGAIRRTITLTGYVDGVSVDERTGRLFTTSAGFASCSSAACAAGKSTMTIIDEETGQVLRSINLSEPSSHVAVDPSREHLVVASSSYYYGVAPSRRSTITIVDEHDGRTVHTLSLGGVVSDAPLIDGSSGHAFLLLATWPAGASATSLPTISRLLVLDTASGRLLHNISLGSAFSHMFLDERTRRLIITTISPARTMTPFPTSIGVTTLVPGDVGALEVFDVRTATLVHRVPFRAIPVAVAIDARTARIYVANAGPLGPIGQFMAAGMVSILDERTYAPLTTATVGANPIAIRVDERTGRVFVLNNGSLGVSITPPDPWSWLPSGVRRLLPFLEPPRPHIVPASISVLDASR